MSFGNQQSFKVFFAFVFIDQSEEKRIITIFKFRRIRDFSKMMSLKRD